MSTFLGWTAQVRARLLATPEATPPRDPRRVTLLLEPAEDRIAAGDIRGAIAEIWHPFGTPPAQAAYPPSGFRGNEGVAAESPSRPPPPPAAAEGRAGRREGRPDAASRAGSRWLDADTLWGNPRGGGGVPPSKPASTPQEASTSAGAASAQQSESAGPSRAAGVAPGGTPSSGTSQTAGAPPGGTAPQPASNTPYAAGSVASGPSGETGYGSGFSAGSGDTTSNSGTGWGSGPGTGTGTGTGSSGSGTSSGSYSIGDFVWQDLNANGAQDPGEPGLSGVQVDLYRAGGTSPYQTTITGSNGYYSFSSYGSGNDQFFVKVALDNRTPTVRYAAMSDRDSDIDATGTTGVFGMGANQGTATSPYWTRNDIDAGFLGGSGTSSGSYSIGDFVWQDLNANGAQDPGEPGLSGVQVDLYRAGGSTPYQSTSTGSNGYYSFSSYGSGNDQFFVKVALDGRAPTAQHASGVSSANDSDIDTACTTAVFGMGARLGTPTSPYWTRDDIDAGFRSATASVGDFVWNDANGNGVQDAGEAGVGGVTVWLTGGGTTSVTTTAPSGAYNFAGVAAGTYQVSFALPAGAAGFSPAGRGGNAALDSDPDPATGVTAPFTVSGGVPRADIDAGVVYADGVVEDRVWNDANGNGLQDPGEAGAAGVAVALLKDGAVVSTTVTDGAGSYLFAGLDPRPTYTVQVTPPAGKEFTTPYQGPDRAADSDIDPASGRLGAVTVRAGQTDTTIDAGLVDPAVVWAGPQPPPSVTEGDAATLYAYRAGGAFGLPLTATFALTADQAGDQAATPGGDYELAAAAGGTLTRSGSAVTVTFAAGQLVVQITVQAKRDNLVEPTEGFGLRALDGPRYRAGTAAEGKSPQADLRIADDPPLVRVSPPSQFIAEGSTGSVTVFRRNGDLGQALTVPLYMGADGFGDPLAAYGTEFTSDGAGVVVLGPNQSQASFTVHTYQGELSHQGPERTGVRYSVVSGTTLLVDPASLPGGNAADVRIDRRPYPLKQFVSVTEGESVTIRLRANAPAGDAVSYTLFPSGQPVPGGDLAYAAGGAGDSTFLFQAHVTVNTLAGPKVLDSNPGVVRVHVEPAPVPPVSVPPVAPPNDWPTVYLADSILAVHAGETKTVTAVVDDPDGLADIASVEWDFDYDGATFRPDASAAGAAVSRAFADPGLYLVAVRVTDSAGHTAEDVGTIEVLVSDDPADDAEVPEDPPPASPPPVSPPPPASPPPAPAPTVTAGTTSIAVGGSVTFTSSGGGDDPYVDWDFNYDGSHFDATSGGTRVAHTFVGPGTYTVAADVWGDDGSDQVVTTTVTVKDIPAVVVLAPVDVDGEEGTPVVLSGLGYAPNPTWVDLFGQPDAHAVVNPGSIVWDFGDGSAPVSGEWNPTHLYAPGDYVASYTLTDGQGHTGKATFNVSVELLPPEVTARVSGPGAVPATDAQGEPLTEWSTDAGVAVEFSATATDFSGIASTAWDFDYDGETFHAQASGLSASHRYREPGSYEVAFRAVANDGTESVAVLTLTVRDVAPTGGVTFASGLAEGSPSTFWFAGVGYVDPAVTPSLWADWEGDGTFDLVEEGQWQGVSVAADGSRSFTVPHTYDDDDTYQANFRVEDAEGNHAASSVTAVVSNVAPSGTLTLTDRPADGRYTPGAEVGLGFEGVSDPSGADAEAGFTYYVEVDGGQMRAYSEPSLTLAGLAPGTVHTARGYVVDKDGGVGPLTGVSFTVLSDRVVENAGSGEYLAGWTNPDGSGGSARVGAGVAYRFDTQITYLSVALVTDGGQYDLMTNFQFDRVSTSALGTGLKLRTDSSELGAFVGDGHVGVVEVDYAGGAPLVVSARGDLGVLASHVGAPDAERISFRNLTGSISGLGHVNAILADGTVTEVSASGGIDRLVAYGVSGPIDAGESASSRYEPAEVWVGPGGVGGSLNYGTRPYSLGVLSGAGGLARLTDAAGRATAFRYDEAGELVGMTTARGAWSVTAEAGGYRAVLQGGQFIAADAPPEDPPPQDGGFWGGLWQRAVSVTFAAGQLAQAANDAPGVVVNAAWTGATLAGRQVQVRLGAVLLDGATQVAWAVTAANEQVLYVGGEVVKATEERAARFVEQAKQLGDGLTGGLTKLLSKLRDLGDAGHDILQAFVDDPAATLRRLAAGVTQGFEDFFNRLGTTLPDKLLGWLAGKLNLQGVGLLTGTSGAEVAKWLLNFFNLNRDGVQAVLASEFGAGNVALVAQVYDALVASWQKSPDGDVLNWVNSVLADKANPLAKALDPDNLKTLALDAGTKVVVEQLVKLALAQLPQVLFPASGGLVKVYNGLVWLSDKLETFGELAGVAGVIAAKVGKVATGAVAPEELAKDIAAFLSDKVLPTMIDFGASWLLGSAATRFPQGVADAIGRLRGTPLGVVKEALHKMRDVAAGVVMKNANPAEANRYQGLIAPVRKFYLGGEWHHVWTVAKSSSTVMLMASEPKRIEGEPQDPDPAGVNAARDAGESSGKSANDKLTSAKQHADAATKSGKRDRQKAENAAAAADVKLAAEKAKDVAKQQDAAYVKKGGVASPKPFVPKNAVGFDGADVSKHDKNLQVKVYEYRKTHGLLNHRAMGKNIASARVLITKQNGTRIVEYIIVENL